MIATAPSRGRMNGTRTPTAGERVAVPIPSIPVREQRAMIVNVMLCSFQSSGFGTRDSGALKGTCSSHTPGSRIPSPDQFHHTREGLDALDCVRHEVRLNVTDPFGGERLETSRDLFRGASERVSAVRLHARA